MGSTEEGSGAGQTTQWWENPSLAPPDLRQHSDSWNLAGDAATASLLQSISQKLVSRTHEVEGMLQKVLEESDRISAAILNTSNSFHMLANTQFIENRTYQDDADVAKNKAPEVQTKPAVTEEDVIARCRAAIAAGIELVNRSYERHEIQDSDSEDEDGHDSPVPIYALIDPYENKPLPYIIGTQTFMQDNKIGLQDPSSEENSKATLTPEETDSEEDFDLESKKNKPIPASSSKIIDDETDSELSDESLEEPSRNHIQNNAHHHHPPPLSSSEDDDDDFFKPSAKATQKVTNDGSSLTNELNKKFSNTSTAATDSNRRGIGFDSESGDDDGDLFGRRLESSGGLFGNSTTIIPPRAQGDVKDNANQRTRSVSSLSGTSKTGVENVRAMPSPTIIQGAAIRRPAPAKSDLFDSDSDDDSDLFSSRPRSASRISNSGNKVVAVKAPTPTVSAQVSAPKSSSGGLFSSDGDDDDEGGLFGSQPAAPSQGSKTADDRAKEETPPLSKPSGPKVPVGGINIFGSAITTALRRQQTPDTDPSDLDSDWEEKTNYSSAPSKKEEVHQSTLVREKEPPLSQKPVEQAEPSVTVGKSIRGGSLFDDNDDDDLFGAAPKKPVSVAKKINLGNANLPSPASSESLENSVAEKGKPGNVSAHLKHPQPEKKTSLGLFSDDDDDLFGIAVADNKKPSKLPVSQLTGESTSSKNQSAVENKDKSITKASSNNTNKAQTSTPAINVPEGSKPQQPSALFSSPSDDDLFAPIPAKVPQTERSVPVMIAEPPPLPAANSKSTSDLFNSPSSDDDLFSAPAIQSSKPDKTAEKIIAEKPQSSSIVESIKEKPPPLISNNIFSSPSDDDDLFSVSTSVTAKKVDIKPMPPKIENSSSEVKVMDNVGNDSKSNKPENSVLKSTNDDLFAPKKTVPGGDVEKTKVMTQRESGSKPNSDPFAAVEDEEDIFSGLVSKNSNQKLVASPVVLQSSKTNKVNLFSSPDSDDDIFAVGGSNLSKSKDNSQIASKPKVPLSESTNDEDIFGIPKSQLHEQRDAASAAIKNTTSETTKNTTSATTKKSAILPAVDDRESPPALPPDPADSDRSVIAIEPTAKAEVVKPQEKNAKPPVGGVALFGGSELAAKINKRKSHLEENSKDTSEGIEEKSTVVKSENQLVRDEVKSTKQVVKDTEVKPTNQVVRENDSVNDDIFGIRNYEDDDDLFSDSPVNPCSLGSLAGQTSPPPLPVEPEKVTANSSPPEADETGSGAIPGKQQAVGNMSLPEDNLFQNKSKVQEKKDPRFGEVRAVVPEKAVMNDSAKEEKSENKEVKEERKERTDSAAEVEEKIDTAAEVKPKRKPVGGVSMFGGGALGGSELFAKVKQRKSMLAPESEEEDEGDSLASSESSKTEEKDLRTDKTSRSPSSGAVSPLSPVSPMSPVSPAMPSLRPPLGLTSTEIGISFEEPVTSSTVLQSVNKTRARGSIKRRPPSRAHRRGENTTASGASATTPAPMPHVSNDVLSDVNTFQSSENKKETISSDSFSTSCKETIPESVSKIDKIEHGRTVGSDSAMESVNVSQSPPQNTKNALDLEDDADDLFGKPRNGSKSSNSSGSGKKSGPSQPSASIFEENDSDDDLFGNSKSKVPSGANLKNKSLQDSRTSGIAKPSPAKNSLFGDDDDDDDIFSSSRKGVKPPSSNTQKKAAIAKPKSNLKPSSGPFEDPLLGNAK